ncbi:DUF4097 domain-containing protein [Nonomuraea turkmeniaca]|uniref:DUF4097 domain-containing protein n=2 Tax=Nonomuraea turkmeniaca TaxID=103838 RepID=A0A5S4FYL1_9ACTN|nr:DUF4097 domain-containing protein [Nonomuraea turkmeniaca]
MPTFDTPDPIVVIVDMATATIHINASDRADTVVEVRPSDEFDDADVQAALHTQIEYADGRLRVWADKDWAASTSGWGLSLDKLVASPADWARSLLGRSGSVHVTIDLPAGSHLDAKAGASLRGRGPLGEVAFTTSYGDIRVEQAGRLRLKTTYGDISVTRSSGHAEVTTTHGDIRIGEIDGTAVVKNSHGDLRLGEVTGDLRLNTAHGDITVDRALAGVAVKTAYGSVRIDEVVSGSVVMETTGGGLDLGIRQGTAAWLDVSSKYGTVDVALHSSDGPGQSDEVVEVRAHTAYGDIAIHRS